jgi:hypothetical protein
LHPPGLAIAASALALLSSCGGGGGGNDNPPPPPAALSILTGSLADGVVDVPYNQTVRASGGTGARTFSVSDGALPDGLVLNGATGVIAGTPAGPAAMTEFTITVEDSGSPPSNDVQALNISIHATSLGRNDSIATATALGNGTFAASISPSGNPNTTLAPDEDYYQITTTAASTVTVDIDAQVNGSPLDSVIELLDEDGVRLTTCAASDTPPDCMDDDEVTGQDLDSFLEVEIGGPAVFYVHVVDFGSNARPDKSYDITISGVN